MDVSEVQKLTRVELVLAVRAGRISKEDASALLFERAERRLRTLENANPDKPATVSDRGHE